MGLMKVFSGSEILAVATDMAKELKLTDGNPDKVMQAEDIAELIIAQLKLNRRVFIKNSSIWSTNP